MASATLTWNAPGGTNSTNQTVKYRLFGASSWTAFSVVSPSTNTATITGLLDNKIYEFQVDNMCTVGGPSSSSIDRKIKIICPNITPTPSYNSVSYSFTHVGGDVTKYDVSLYQADGVTLLGTKSHTSPSGTMSDVFNGLSGSTGYKIKVTVYAGVDFSFSSVCAPVSFTTGATPICNAPTSVVATIS